jgi:uncharacterized membrane protein YhaH (DUF805 family)
LIIAFFLITILVLIQESYYEFAGLVLFYVPIYLFFFAQGAKRCHDMGYNGWWQIVPFFIIWMIFGKGEEGISNKYGRNPKI